MPRGGIKRGLRLGQKNSSTPMLSMPQPLSQNDGHIALSTTSKMHITDNADETRVADSPVKDASFASS